MRGGAASALARESRGVRMLKKGGGRGLSQAAQVLGSEAAQVLGKSLRGL